MIGMEMRDDDIRQVIEIHARLFESHYWVADTIYQDGPLFAENNHMSVLMVFGRYCIG
jgi:hypothetical protein